MTRASTEPWPLSRRTRIESRLIICWRCDWPIAVRCGGGEAEGAASRRGWDSRGHAKPEVSLRETGLTRGLGTWTKVNKKDGFDCQSCAWPSPDEERNFFEFCESGAKALASEATKKHITPDFFREYSIADLQQQSDYWLEKQGRLVHPMVKRTGATHYEPIEWDLLSYYKGEERVAKLFMIAPFNMPRGCTATYFPEASVLIPINSTADRSNTPTSKSIVIRIAPSTETAEAVQGVRRNASATRAL